VTGHGAFRREIGAVQELMDAFGADVIAAGLAVGIILALVERSGRPAVLRSRILGLVLSSSAVLSMVLGSVRLVPGVLTAVVATIPVDDDDRVHPLGAWVHLFAVASLVGIWATVPDVEPALAAGACLFAVGASRIPLGRAPGRTGTSILVVTVAGAAVAGAAGRGLALVATATVGQVLIAPLVAGLHRRALPGRAIVALAVVHLVVAVPVGREVRWLPLPVAVAVALGSLVVGAAAAAVVCRTAPVP
jgi:hypothetical protein